MKRYVATIDLYVYADNDEQASELATQCAQYLDCYENNYDNKAKVTALYEQLFGTLRYREINV